MMTVLFRRIFASRHLGNVITSSKIVNFSRLHRFFKDLELSSEEVSEILRTNEFSMELKDDVCCVESYESNQLPSNSPMEDTRSEAKCLLSKGMLFGVFDGHSGPACAQILAKRLFDYICAGLLSKDILQKYAMSLEGKEPPLDLLEKYNETFDLLPELKALYRDSFAKYVHNLLQNSDKPANIEMAMTNAILSLDEDISNEALNCDSPEIAAKTMQVALAGAVSCVAHINGSHLHVANVGDCRAVLGVLTKDNKWKAKTLTRDHSARNVAEIKRIRSDHPASEKGVLCSEGRLLGGLAPLRAFGDFSYKWSVEVLDQLVKNRLPSELAIHAEMIKWRSCSYLTPPYLTVMPEITQHKLTSDDKFLIIATDGLWDEITSSEAVRIVASHLRGKIVLNPFRMPEEGMKLGDIHKLLLRRKQCFDAKPVDRNGATHLLRNAVGCDAGRELARPVDQSRYYRDDMTIVIVYLNAINSS